MEDLSQHILDIAFNSLEAGAADIEITVREDIKSNMMEFKVLDNGRGINEEEILKMMDPFYTTKKNKRVGLGIPLLQEAVHRCGGKFEIKALPQKGTSITANFPYNHLDRAPLGDITGTLIALISSHKFLNLSYYHKYNDKTFSFNTKDIQARMKDIPLHTPEVLVWLKDQLTQEITEMRRKNKNEKPS